MMLAVLITILAAAIAFLVYVFRQDWKYTKRLREQRRELEETKRKFLKELDELEEKHRTRWHNLNKATR